jgi:hypothetical protein
MGGGAPAGADDPALLPALASLSLGDDAAARSAKDAAPAGVDAAPPAAECVALEGVSLAALRAFASEHAGQRFTLPAGDTLSFEELTTTQVVEAVVKPATQRAGKGGTPCTYAQLLRQQARARRRCRTLAHRLAPAG